MHTLRRYLIVILIFFGFLLFAQSSLAKESDFSFDYDVLYKITDSGKAVVTQNITLTNLATEVYAQNYTITIFSERIDKVTAFDSEGTIIPSIEKRSGQTAITVPFNARVVGINKKLRFTLSYENYDIAHKNGRIWEIIIPGVTKNEELHSYAITLMVPNSFGEAAYVSPPSLTKYHWTLSEHNGNGINALFGEEQEYWFRLKYHLKNTTASEVLQEITLPPDTAFQKILISTISETPENVIQDADGNWLAQFKLKSKTTRDIIVEGTALTYIRPRKDFVSKPLTPQELTEYTKSQKYWDQSEAIKEIAQRLTTPESIYNYVVSTLTYNYNRITPGIERLGAVYALEHPQDAVCMEFSDLFVAMARAAGIAARVNHGYAYTTNSRLQPITLISDVLHAWPEYYDHTNKIWIPVDPTWGNTTHGIDYFHKLDFNHITFAILGKQSDYPYPAGSFRNETSEKDVFVEFANTQPKSIPTFTTSLLAKYIPSGFINTQVLRLQNTGTTLWQPQQIIFENPAVKLANSTLESIPPHGYIEVPLSFSFPLTLIPKNITIEVNVDGKLSSFEVVAVPILYIALPILLLVAILVFLVIRKKRYG